MFLRTLVALLPFHSLTTQPDPPPPPQTVEEQVVALRVVDLVNAEREKAGCPALTVNTRLASAAQAHSRDMHGRQYFAHVNPDGQQPWDRMVKVGYRYRIAAENIGAGFSTPEAMVRGWMKSPAHRENILNCKLEETGVGYIHADDGRHFYWTQDFGLGH